MNMLVGGAAQGKRSLALTRGYAPADICDGASCPVDALPDTPALGRLHLLIRRQMQAGIDPMAYAKRLCHECRELLVICDEVGLGVVPVDRFERDWRECVGRVCCFLAAESSRVERVVAGIPLVLKAEGTMTVFLVRHGQTAGNLARRYVGRIDEPLLPSTLAGFCNMAYPAAGVLYVSPMLRCQQTAAELYPALMPQTLPDLRECDFGAFEGKTHAELADDPAYRTWIAANGQADPPGGEGVSAFKDRCCTAFAKAVRESASRGERRVAVVAHGGVLMVLLERYARPARLFYEWQTENLGGYAVQIDLARWEDGRTLTVTHTIEPGGMLTCFTPSR